MAERDLALRLSAVAFAVGALGLAWIGASRGGPLTLLLVVLMLILALVSGFAWALYSEKPLRSLVVLIAILPVQLALLTLATHAGRYAFELCIWFRLDEYGAIAARQLSRLSRVGQDTVRENTPHATLASAVARRFDDGGTVVYLTLAAETRPRNVLLYPTNHVLPQKDKEGHCLKEVFKGWYWYRGC